MSKSRQIVFPSHQEGLERNFMKRNCHVMSINSSLIKNGSIRVKSMTMNKHMLPLYMDSVFLQIEQCDNDVQFKDLLKHASSFLKSNLRQPMEKDQKSILLAGSIVANISKKYINLVMQRPI
ncbi:hypothetical protein TNCV_1566411 [Trichonephila clavipes]|nr:hypothetical protein TNCV_1566411 [Trichonephila clavipes]